MDEYQAQLNSWGRRVAESLGVTVADDTEFSIEAEKGWGGCDTCGHGDGSGIKLYANGKLIEEWEFYRLGDVLRGILNA
jgi:hypothetical protein